MEYNHIELDIYPKNYDCELAGFFSRDLSGLQYGINEVKLKIIWFKSSSSHLVFASMDSLYFPECVADCIYQYFINNHNIPSEYIICNATHTHSSPSLSVEKFGEILKDYLDGILILLRNKLSKLGDSFQPCEIFFNLIRHNNAVVNRRRLVRDVLGLFVKKKALLLPNWQAPIDNYVRSLTIKDMCGNVKAVIHNISCHPVFATSQLISSDFPGLINNNIESKGVEFSMFLQGFCGDLRPNLTSTSFFLLPIKSYIKSLFYGPVFRKTLPLDLSCFSKNISNLILLNIGEERYLINEFYSHSFSYNFKSLTGKISRNVTIKLFYFRNVIGVSIPAEVLSSYFLFLKKIFPDNVIFPLGFSEGMIGYLPMYNELHEGGYEVESSKNYGWDSRFDRRNLEFFLNDLVIQIKILLMKETI